MLASRKFAFYKKNKIILHEKKLIAFVLYYQYQMSELMNRLVISIFEINRYS